MSHDEHGSGRTAGAADGATQPAWQPPPALSPWRRTVTVWRHPANRGGRLAAVLRSAGWLLYRKLSRRPITRSGPGGFRYLCNPRNNFCKRMILYGGLPDHEEMRFLIDYLRPGDGFLDVGANCGIFSLLAAARVGPSGRVDAFEPGEDARIWLRRNLELNGLDTVHVHPHAAADAAGTARFVGGMDVGSHLRTDDDGDAATVPVDCICLDDAVGAHRYAAGKLDIEGAEPLALSGARAMLEAGNPPVWIVELNGKLRLFGWSEESFAEWLGRRGFELAVYEPATRRLRFGPRLWTEPGLEPEEKNLLAVHRPSLGKIRARLERA